MLKHISKIFILFILLNLFPLQSSISLEPKNQILSDSPRQVVKANEMPASLNVIPDYGKIPLYFIPNEGQVEEKVLFYAKTPMYNLWLTREGLVFDRLVRYESTRNDAEPLSFRAASPEYKRDVSRLRFINASRYVEVVPVDMTDHRVNYFKGNDKSEWRTNIATSKVILYKELYKNIDLKVYGIENQIEYDYIVKPGGRVEDVSFAYEKVKNSKINEDGSLVVETKFGELIHAKPLCYQMIKSKKVKVEANYREIKKNIFCFEVNRYRKDINLIIDPLVYSTYLGGSDEDYGHGIAVDKEGAAYVVGDTLSIDFPSKKPAQKNNAGLRDVFITKINADGNALVYSTYLGGADDDDSGSIAVDSKGAAYVTGYTKSTNFPTNKAVQKKRAGETDAFITKIDPKGNSLLYSTYLGGSDIDYGFGIAVDKNGAAFVTGQTYSTDFKTKKPLYGTLRGSIDAFVTKLNKKGNRLIYSTYLGGSDQESGSWIAVDKNGATYASGWTTSSNFPTKKAVQKKLAGQNDAFITKINSKGSALVYSTYLGGSAYDYGWRIAVDKNGAAYVEGSTTSSNFPTKKAIQRKHAGGDFDAYIAKIRPKGKTLVYSTFLGGSGSDSGWGGIAVDKKGAAYVTGYTSSTDFPTKNPIQANILGIRDAFIAKINPQGTAMAYSTYLGGSDSEYGKDIAVDEKGAAYVTGYTSSTDFPTENPIYGTFKGVTNDAFISKIK